MSKVTKPGRVARRGEEGPVGSRAPGAPPAFVPAPRPGSQPLAFQWPPDALSSSGGRFGGGVGWGQGTINLPAVCAAGEAVWLWVGWGMAQDSLPLFWKPGLGSDKGRRGESMFHPSVFPAPA